MRTPRSFTLPALVVGVAALTGSCQRTPERTSSPAAPAAAAAPAATTAAAATAEPAAGGRAGTPAASGRVVVQVTEEGFVPSEIPAQMGKPITLAITRKTDKTCAREILFKGQPGKTDLPLDKEVEVTYTPKVSGKVPFGCAMGMMIGGSLQVR